MACVFFCIISWSLAQVMTLVAGDDDFFAVVETFSGAGVVLRFDSLDGIFDVNAASLAAT